MKFLRNIILFVLMAIAMLRARIRIARVKRQWPGCDGVMMTAPTPGTGVSISGVTTIRWGTTGLTATVVALDYGQNQEVERIYIENGSGIKATRILLTQGHTWNVTFIDLTTLTPPVVGDALTMANILGDGTVYTYKGVVVENAASAARKTDLHKTITVESLTLIDTVSAGSISL